MKIKVFKIVTIVLLLAGYFSSCSNREGPISNTTDNVTGTVIGSYANGWVELLVQVDRKYPIAKEYLSHTEHFQGMWMKMSPYFFLAPEMQCVYLRLYQHILLRNVKL